VVDRPKIDGDHEARKAGGTGDLNHAGFGVTVGGCRFVIEETLDEVAEKMGELTALGGMDGTAGGLDVERFDLKFAVREKTLKGFRHELPA
jgi:hypothetical protein